MDEDYDGYDEHEGPWSHLGEDWPQAESLVVPAVPLTDDIREENFYPPTITTVAAEGVSQHIVFDPSMKQHMVAMRASEPRFADAAQGARWYAARRAATAAVLRGVADSGFADRLVLRGSILLKSWFGDAAREPGDLDFIVEGDAADSAQLLETVADAAEAASRDCPVRINAADALTGFIWTYDRVPGERLVLRWRADGCPDGSVQLDFVFGEVVPEAPESTEVFVGEGGSGSVTLRTASAGLSLAWKLLWLVTDSYPQGKDVYDALLLAEAVPLNYDTLRAVVLAADATYEANAVTLKTVEDVLRHVDWEAFWTDYPTLAVDKKAFGQRLLDALEPAFTASGVHATEYQQRVRWMSALIERCREIRRNEGADAVQAELVRIHAKFAEAVVVTRELDSTGTMTVDAAAREALAAPAWQEWCGGSLLRENGIYAESVSVVRASVGKA